MTFELDPYILKAEDRFWSKVAKGCANSCWVWAACTNKDGYGMIRVGSRTTHTRKTVLAHRFSWMIHNGPIPDGLFVLHTCDNPPCVNPSHLFLGTNQDNIDDKVAKGRSQRLMGEENGKTKLTKPQVLEIRELSKAGVRNKEICKKYTISKTHIHRIINREVWKHV